MLIENDQAIFRGPRFNWPTEIWDTGLQAWKPYKGDVPKPGHWGSVISPEEAKEFMEPF